MLHFRSLSLIFEYFFASCFRISGDILAGMIASLLAQGLSPVDAACCGVYLHGMAGDLAAQRYTMQGMLPTDLLAMIPQAFQDTGIK